MKRFLCLLCLLLAFVCLFAACGGEETPSGGETTPPDTEQSGGENNDQSGEQQGGETHSHFFGMWKVTTEASCTAKGEEKRTCSCGAEETREVAMLAHTYGEWSITTDATCALDGEEKRSCACGDVQSKVIAATGKHTFGDWSATAVENCVTSGAYKRACACGAQESKTVPATGKHEYGIENTCVVCQAEMAYTKTLLYELNADGTGYLVNGLSDKSLAEVIIPPYHRALPVVGICSYAFSVCPSLASIEFPTSVKSIQRNAFYECPLLVEIDNGVSYVDKWVVACETRVKTVILRANTVGIGDGAFYDCAQITALTLPATVKYVGAKAFYGCTALSWVMISEGVCEFGDYAFEKCAALATIKLPASLLQIGRSPFKGCTNLERIEVNAGNAVYHSAGNCLIETASKTVIAGLKNAVIPADGSVTGLADEAFADCTMLSTLVIPSVVTRIGENVFDGCTALQYTVYEGGKYLGNTENPYFYLAAVADKTVTAFTIANTAKIIGREAFLDCEALASIVIPASVSEIGDRAFRGCKALSAVTFDGESALQRIGENAFQACYALTAFTIPAAVNEIGSEAFIDCDLLKSVTFECVEGWSATRDELTHAFSGSIGNAEEAANRLTQSSWPNGSGYADYRWNRVPPSDQE